MGVVKRQMSKVQLASTSVIQTVKLTLNCEVNQLGVGALNFADIFESTNTAASKSMVGHCRRSRLCVKAGTLCSARRTLSCSMALTPGSRANERSLRTSSTHC